MNKTPFILIAMLISTLLFMNFQCEEKTIPPKYSFVEKINVGPYQKVYALGDTITVSFITADKTLYDELSNQRVRTDTTYLPLGFTYQKLFSPPSNTVDTLTEIITPNATSAVLTFSPEYNAVMIETDCSLDHYNVVVKFVTKAIGIYSISAPGGLVGDCPNKIDMSPLVSCYFTFNLSDCNKDVYLSLPDSNRVEQYPGYTESHADRKEIFIFKVE